MVSEIANGYRKQNSNNYPAAEPSGQGVARTLQALHVLGSYPQGLTISEMASELGTSRQVVYRLVGSLQAGGFAIRGNDGRVRLGLGVLDLARRVYPALRSLATPVLRELAERTGATAHLTVVSNEEAYALAVEAPSSADLHLAYRVGAVHRLDRGAAGRAILEWRKVKDDPSRHLDITENTISPKWVSTTGELQAGAQGVAAAIRGVPGLEASIGVVCLAILDEEKIGPVVADAADELAELLTR